MDVRTLEKVLLEQKLDLERNIKKYIYINFDDERLSDFSKDDLDISLEVLYKVYGEVSLFFFDEIQNVGEWYLFINRLLRNGVYILLDY